MVDGRDVEALCQVFWQASQMKSKPTAVVAKTFKGRGVPSKHMFSFLLGVVGNSCLHGACGGRRLRLAGWAADLVTCWILFPS